MNHSTPSRGQVSGYRIALLLASIVLLVETVTLSFTFVMPALPSIASHYRTSNAAWTLTALTLAGAAFIPLFGKLGDMHGKKRWAQVSALLFVVGCLLSATATSFAVFLAGRVLQGAVLALVPLAYGLIRDLLPPALVTTGLGFVATGAGAGAVIGPLLGGYLIDNFGFRGVFWFLIFYTVVAIAAITVFVPESPIRTTGRLDLVGVGLLTIGATVLALGAGQAHTWGLLAGSTVGCVLGGIAVLGFWLWYSRIPQEPLIDLGLLSQRPVALTLSASFFYQLATTSVGMLLPIFAMMSPHAHLGYGFGLTAFAMAQISVFGGVTGMICGPLAGRLCSRLDPGVVLSIGGALLATSCLLFVANHGSIGALMLVSAVNGIANGFCGAALPNLLVRHVPAQSQGIAGGMLSEAGGIGNSLGTQLMIVFLSIPGVEHLRGTAIYHREGFVYAFLALAGFAAIIAVVGLFSVDRRRALVSPPQLAAVK